MTRSIGPSEALVLERLELERPELVTMAGMEALLAETGARTEPRVFAARLRDKGWLLPTGQRGVWEFAPAAVAGPYSAHDPLMPLKAFLARSPGSACALTFQAAAWAHGLADRVPSRPEVAASDAATRRRLPDALDASVFSPALLTESKRGVPTLQTESIFAHLSASPSAVRSWASAAEWLPGLSAALRQDRLVKELEPRPGAVRARAGYLLQGLRPDLAEAVQRLSLPGGKTWFGPRGKLKRHDNRWQVADTLLPFDPRRLAAAP
ncbi:MAG: type IV toxin-antitoxin system AbiEi family antitoxin [Bifidobacteriaceae bacterium]|jgi:hypothetical protein|nr:type IV toxin-antitoxin system AbiEi family antitoxin [Bifidobacteriaceae bacterium]